MSILLDGQGTQFAGRDYWKRVTYVYSRWLTRYYQFLHRRN